MRLIAELGQVHEGSLGLAMKYVERLSDLGVDSIKFQMHLAEYESSDSEQWRVPFSLQDRRRVDYWRRTGFCFDEWRVIKDFCDQNNVEFLCTPFSLKAVDWLEELSVERYKVGSADWNNIPLLARIAETKKPVVISAGMANTKLMKSIIDSCFGTSYPVSVMYCVTAYPAKPEMIDMSNLELLRSELELPIGYSDHSGNPLTGLVAFLNGAGEYEFHVTNSIDNFGPDVAASLTFEDVVWLKKSISYLGRLGSGSQENEDLKKLNDVFSRSLGVREDLSSGDVISLANIEVKKPGGCGLPLSEYTGILGKRVNKVKAAGEFLNGEDIE